MIKKISVIIPTFNEKANIGKLLAQLAGEPFLEIIVTDGGSNDGTIDLCNSFDVNLVNAPLGRGVQLNAGAEVARGEMLFFLHADSQLNKSVLSELFRALDEGRQWGCFRMAFNDTSLLLKLVALFSGIRVRLFSICYGDQGIFCRREIFKKIKYPEIPIMEDHQLSQEMRRTVGKAYLLPGKIYTSARRFRKGGILRTILKIQLIKLFYVMGVSPEILKKMYEKRGY